MKKKAKVLFVSQEVFPYLEETPISKISRYLPQGVQEKGKEIRVFMPRYIKKQFADNPLFADTKVVFSLYNDEFSGQLDKELSSKLISEHITAKDVKQVNEPTYLNWCKMANDYSDGIVVSSEDVNP